MRAASHRAVTVSLSLEFQHRINPRASDGSNVNVTSGVF